MVNLFEPRNITIKLQNKLNEALSKNKQITLMWVHRHPRHTDIEGN